MPAGPAGQVTLGCVGLTITEKWDPSTLAMTSIVVVNTTGAPYVGLVLTRADGVVWAPTIPAGTTTVTAAQMAGQGFHTINDVGALNITCPQG